MTVRPTLKEMVQNPDARRPVWYYDMFEIGKEYQIILNNILGFKEKEVAKGKWYYIYPEARILHGFEWLRCSEVYFSKANFDTAFSRCTDIPEVKPVFLGVLCLHLCRVNKRRLDITKIEKIKGEL